MAVTESNYTVSNSSTTNYSFTFPYLKTTDVKLSIDGVASSAFTFANATTIQLNSNPTVGEKIRIYRDTDDSKLEAEFFAGSAIKSSDLNDNFNQNLYVTQESNNKIDAAWTSGDETIISTETWLSQDDKVATNKAIDGRVDSKINTAITTKVVGGDRVTATASGGDTVTLKVTPASLVNSDVNASAAIDGTKISPDFGSQNIATTGTVDGRDVSADGIRLDSMETGATADQNASEIRSLVESASDSNVFTDADHTKLNAIEPSATADQTDAEIRAAVEAASDSNVFTDADHTKLNAIEASATADQTVGEIKTLLASSPLDASHLAANSVGDSEIATGALDNRYYTETELNAGQLDNRYYTETESDARYFNISTGDTIKDGDTFPDNDTTIATTAAINDRIIDLVDDVGGFVPIANETSFPNANPDVNNGTGTIVSIGALAGNLTSNGSGVITIANGTVGNSTVTITGAANSTTYSAGYGLLVETTSTLNTYTFHRLSSKATEVSTVAGNISNINAVANNATNINSAVSNASNINSAVSNASNINSAVSNASNINTVAGNNTNINAVAGANSNITTVAGSISNVNTAAGSIANINTVATNISNVNDFSDKYRVASSAPTSSLDTGDLYFDTSANELKVYNGSAWQGGVTATGNLAGLGANTFTGHQSLGDNNRIYLGAGNDLQLVHDGNNSYIHENGTGNLYIRSNGGSVRIDQNNGDDLARFVADGDVELYYDGVKKFETTSYGAIGYGYFYVDGSSGLAYTAPDNSKVSLGTGNDLQIYHDGTDSKIVNDNDSGKLILNSYQSRIRSAIFAVDNEAGTEHQLHITQNGSTNLYYDGVKKFETTSAGSTLSGDLLLDSASAEINLKSGVGTESGAINWTFNTAGTNYGRISLPYDTRATLGLNIHSGYPITFTGGNSSETLAKFTHGGAVDFYYDNSKKAETVAAGFLVSGELVTSQNAYSRITHQENGTSKWSCGLRANGDDDYHLYREGGSGNVVIDNGNFSVNDSQKALFGTGDDLQIYHSGSHTYIDNNTGNLYIRNNVAGDVGGDIHIRARVGEQGISVLDDSEVQLYYDGVEKFNTRSGGCTVHGDLTVTTELNLTGGSDANKYLDAQVGTNAFHIRKVTGGDTGHEFMSYFKGDAECALYYDNVKRFETTSSGAQVNGLMSHLTFGDSGYSIGNEYHMWKRVYVVSASNKQELLDKDGNSLANGGAYRFHAHIPGTGTDQSATAVYWNHNGTWKLNVTYQSGVNSNHPEFIIDGGVPTISTDHGSNYTIAVLAERMELSEGTGNDNRSGFGADAYFSLTGNDSVLRFNPDGASSGVGSGNIIVHQGNVGSSGALASSTVYTSAVHDSKGDLRKIIRIQKSSAHTLVADDAGKGVGISSGGVTVPQNVFASGDAVTIINQSGSDQTITQGSGVTMYNAADASTGNRTLAGRGMATIWFNNGTSCYISGAGLS